ncbi:hypothetical protein KP509_24G032700 [Ceratopteris richardii]|uniref:Uncharacterized protein n=1 Tax=Ceratopteris richardii TaxID=49495 RepID=A0A8T2RW59_CERRI|nr:hypothetical protein KP509_24G032700 [Ceratopteris richardii]
MLHVPSVSLEGQSRLQWTPYGNSLSEIEMGNISCGFISETVMENTSRDIGNLTLVDLISTPKDHCKIKQHVPTGESFHATVWETPNWRALQASIYDSRSFWNVGDLKDLFDGSIFL